MRKDVKELLKEIVIMLDKIRCYSAKDTIEKYIKEEIDVDEAIELLMEFNVFFDSIQIEEGKDGTITKTINEFVKIGDTDISIHAINSLTKTKYYSFKDNDYKFGIILNKSTNDFKNFNLTSDEANEIIKKFCFKKIKESGFETIREIRDRYYLKIEREEEKTNFKRKLREKIKEIGPEKKEKAEEFIKTNKIKEYWYNKFEDDTYIVFYHYIKFTKYLSFKEKAYFKL